MEGWMDELTGHILVLWMPAIPAGITASYGYEIFRKRPWGLFIIGIKLLNNPQLARHAALRGLEDFAGDSGEGANLLSRRHDHPGQCNDFSSNRSGYRLVRLSLDELHAQIVLQFFELNAESGLGHIADACRPAEMAFLDQDYQILECPQVHFLTQPIWSFKF